MTQAHHNILRNTSSFFQRHLNVPIGLIENSSGIILFAKERAIDNVWTKRSSFQLLFSAQAIIWAGVFQKDLLNRARRVPILFVLITQINKKIRCSMT